MSEIPVKEERSQCQVWMANFF